MAISYHWNARSAGGRLPGPHYKWLALSNTTLGIAAGASLLRGGRYVHDEQTAGGATAGTAGPAEVTAEVALGASPELAVEVAAEIDGEATRQAQREAEQRA